MKNEINTNQNWASEISKFYKFLEDGRQFLKQGGADLDLIQQVRAMLEVEKRSSNGNSYIEAKFDSAIYRDIEQIAILKRFLENYSLENINKYHNLIVVEISGLEGDLSPRSILTSTLPAAIFTGLSLTAAWAAIGAVFFDIDLFQVVVEVIARKIGGIDWIRTILSLVFVIGGFVGIGWFVSFSYKNQKQVQYLKSLERVMSLVIFFREMEKQKL